MFLAVRSNPINTNYQMVKFPFAKEGFRRELSRILNRDKERFFRRNSGKAFFIIGFYFWKGVWRAEITEGFTVYYLVADMPSGRFDPVAERISNGPGHRD